MIKIIALTTLDNTLNLKKAVEEAKKEVGNVFTLKKVYLDDYEDPEVSLETLEREIDEADIVLVDIRGDVRVGRELPRILEGKKKTVIVLLGGGQHIQRLTKMGKFDASKIFKGPEKEFNVHTFMRIKKLSELTEKIGRVLNVGMMKDMRNWILAQRYYYEGTVENLKNLILMVLKEYGGVKTIKSVPLPTSVEYGLYLPKKGILRNLEEYKRELPFDPSKPIVGVLKYSGMHFEDSRDIADIIFENLKNHANVIFVVSRPEYNLEALKKYLPTLDLLINVQYFRIHGGPYGGDPEPTYEYLQKVGAPLLRALRSYNTGIESWRKNKEGLHPLEVVIGVTLPELDGSIEPIFVSGLEKVEDSEIGKVKVQRAIADRVKKLTDRVKKWLELRRLPNEKKRIAIVTYDYPPGEENLASAGYLDVFESLEVLLRKLKENGYKVDIPEKKIKEVFLSNGVVNNPRYLDRSKIRISSEEYISWFNELPSAVKEEVVKHWGEPPGDIMVERDEIIIPGVILGNVFLGVQPSRGVFEDPEKTYHDKDLPPHHQYLAFYLYLEKKFKADAIIHFGMHGTLEFTKGKEVALSSECFPDVLIGNMPNIYYYWVGNPSESTIAKRRSYAVCISYASPPMKHSGLYEKYLILEELISQYESQRDEKTLEEIYAVASELNLPADIEFISKELYRMKRRLIPYGLHVMDSKFDDAAVVDYLLGVLRMDREYPSLFRLIAEKRGLNWEEIKDTKKEEEILQEARRVIDKIIRDKKPIGWLPKGYAEFVKDIARRLDFSRESEAIIRVLNGRYIIPSAAGDPIKNPEVYPTGRGMYGFDPRSIPTISAEVRGRKYADTLIRKYLEKYGRYPESIGIVLWGFETMKTGGDTIATILSLLGVRLKHRKNPWFKDLEIIPLEELKRPRIDVVVTICGIFRDTFGLHIELMNRAVDMVANLDEPVHMNFVRKHYLELKDKSERLALARIFGPSPTEYATSMRTLVEDGNWKDEKELVKSYDDSMSYAYLGRKIEKAQEVFSEVLKNVDIVTQERDNTEYEVVDLDHYYEFAGGLYKSVEEKRNRKVEILIADTTEGDVEVEDLGYVISRAVRTRLLNPKWLEGMLKHDFHGAQKIRERVEHLVGFSATTGNVENWIYENIADRLLFDENMRKRLFENNPYATIGIAERLLEANRRGYWITSEDKIRKLQRIVSSMEGQVE